MSTQLDPTQLAIEFLRRDQSNLSPAQYLKRLKQLELEFADLLTLSSAELKEEIYFAWRLGCIDPDLMPQVRQIDLD
ncbi:YdiH family protein [Escherichia coli]|nr:YdiH family protein [Escherichia coli]